MTQPAQSVRILLSIIAVVSTLAALRACWFVSMPIAFAVFLTVLIHPWQRWLQRRVSRWVGLAIVLLAIAAILGSAFLALWYAGIQIAAEGPALSEKLRQHAQSLMNWAQRHGLPLDWEDFSNDGNGASWITRGISSIWTALGLIGVILILLVLLLFEAEQWRIKTRTSFPGKTSTLVLDTANIIFEKLQRYLMVRLFISALSGALVVGWCTLLGIKLALVWGLVTFFMNFIPNIGSIISYMFPTATALLTHDWEWALLTLFCIASTDLVVGNFLDPRLQGKSLRLSPFVVMVSVIFWGWMWGVGGMMLGVPITATLVIICMHVPSLEPIGRLLGKPGGAI